uniref:Fucolectin tachylectin-4 pentraxin-1 domain-containing protein n=3 Tax=Magallana gigas TaxID=29159 RepID=A0A8W8M1V7_MAGGI
ISLKKGLDMFLLLLVPALVYICYVDIITCHYELTNVAYSKPVTLSSLFDNDSRYIGSKVVNGLFSDLIATTAERSPWLRIDLGARFEINEIEVFARTDCCVNQLHDVDFKVGGSIHHMHRCGHYTGPTTAKGQRIAVFCPRNTIGRYVQIQITKGPSNYLTPAEVLVWGVKVN